MIAMKTHSRCSLLEDRKEAFQLRSAKCRAEDLPVTLMIRALKIIKRNE